MKMITSAAALASSLPRLADKRVLIIGDVMLDHYVIGAVHRISPEAPVPVVRKSHEQLLLGGAGNVAMNVKSLGGAPHLVSVAGADVSADSLRQLLIEESIAHAIVTNSHNPTTVKTRVIAQNQQIVRIDSESDAPLPDSLREELLRQISAVIDQHQVVILSDYGKGLVSAPFLKGLSALLDKIEPRPKVFIDPKVKNFSLYHRPFLITPNAKEALEGAGSHSVDAKRDALLTGMALFKKTHCENLLITLGPRGMVLFEGPGKVWHIPTVARKVYDVTGAGDTVIGALALCVAADMPLLDGAIIANYAAGFVVGEMGAAHATPGDIEEAIRATPTLFVESWLSEKEEAQHA